jgi:hypothetical protein
MNEEKIKELLAYTANGIPKAEKAIAERYYNALKANDEETIREFEAFGPTMRHRLDNMNAFQHQQRFGFYHTELDEYNWLKKPKFIIERVTFKANANDNHPSYIELGEGSNGLWTYGIGFNYGNGGHYSGVSIFGDLFRTRQLAYDAALAKAKGAFEAYAASGDTNSKKVLEAINGLIMDSRQLSLF